MKGKLNWGDLDQVKGFANKVARMNKMQQSVIRRAGSSSFLIIATRNEKSQTDATVVYRTGNFK